MGVRSVTAKSVEEAVARAATKANRHLPDDVRMTLEHAAAHETSALGRDVLARLVENARLAAESGLAVCQDTGMAVVLAELGQDAHLAGGTWDEAIHRGISRAYTEACYRGSVVADPFERRNTGDNTPAVIHYVMVSGNRVRITVVPKGFGSENMSAVRMLTPAAGMDGARRVVLETVETAGPNACPPLVIGIGVGGTQDHAAWLAKKALLRPLGTPNPDTRLDALEREWLDMVNATGIGPGGFGGNTTALGLHIETYPTHIAGLPVAVALSCHALRRASVEV